MQPWHNQSNRGKLVPALSLRQVPGRGGMDGVRGMRVGQWTANAIIGKTECQIIPTPYPTRYPTASPTYSPTVACTPGRYFYTNWATPGCVSCAAGTYSNTYQALSCTECVHGRFASVESTACMDCPVGKYHTSSGAVCIGCAFGSVSEAAAQTSCAVCPSGKYQAGATSTCAANARELNGRREVWGRPIAS